MIDRKRIFLNWINVTPRVKNASVGLLLICGAVVMNTINEQWTAF